MLRSVVESIGAAAPAAGVMIATGDTKVVPRGKADRLFINTSGIGLVAEGVVVGRAHPPGDQVLLSGPIGEHGIAVMLAREALEIEADIRSDSAPLHRMAAGFLRAPTTRCLEIRLAGAWPRASTRWRGRPVSRLPSTNGAFRCARSRRVRDARARPAAHRERRQADRDRAADDAARALEAMRFMHGGRRIIGEVLDGPEDMVLLKTEAGGSRVLDMLVGDPLPRIC